MSTGLTYLTYGNVTLFRVVTRQIAQEVVFDESRTDALYMKYTIRVSGFLHGHQDWMFPYQVPLGPGSGNVAGAHQAVRYQLGPRLPFKLVVGANEDYTGGTVLFQANPAPTQMIPPPARSRNINLYQLDVCNGPRCLQFDVTHITGNELFAVEATFEICLLECMPDGTVPQNTYGVLNNRWSTHDSIDTNMRTTRTYTGVMTLASANINAQMLRWVVAPPLQPLFRRDHMDFVCSEDGLKIRWTIVDVEIAVSAPFPARKWNVRHTVETGGTDGEKMATGSIDVSLEADSNVNKADLIEIAIYVITGKLLGVTPPNLKDVPRTFVVDSISFTDYIGDLNMITASATVHQTVDAWSGMWGAFVGFGKPLAASDFPAPLTNNVGANAPYNVGTGQAYDRSVSWGGYAGQIPDVEGPAKIIGIFACFLQNPCNDFHQILIPTQTLPSQNKSQQQNDLQTPFTGTVSTDLPDQSQNPIYSPSMLTCAYKFWQLDTMYRRRMMMAQMPIASNPSTPYAPTSAVVALSGPQQQLVIRAHAERIGDWPEYPSPNNLPAWPVPASPPAGYVAPVMTVLDYRVKPGTPLYSATGQAVYRASFQILVALSRPLTPDEALLIGNDKWTNNGLVVTDNTLTNSNW